MECPAVASRDVDFIANGDIAKKMEMGIAVRGIDRGAALAGIGSQFDMTRTEGKRLAAAPCKNDGAGLDPLHLDPRNRPGIGPRPWLRVAAGGDGLAEGALQQRLRNQRLGVGVGALAEQDETGESEEQRGDEAGHWDL